MSLPVYMCDFHLHGIRSIMMARTLTYRHHTSPRDRSLEYLRTFLSAEVAPRRIFFAHQRRNKSISSQGLSHSRIYSSYVSHATVEICSRENLEGESASGIRIKLPACGRRLLFHLCLFHIASDARPFIFFHACYSHYTNWPVPRTEVNRGTRAACVVTSAHTLPVTCDSQLRIN